MATALRLLVLFLATSSQLLATQTTPLTLVTAGTSVFFTYHNDIYCQNTPYDVFVPQERIQGVRTPLVINSCLPSSDGKTRRKLVCKLGAQSYTLEERIYTASDSTCTGPTTGKGTVRHKDMCRFDFTRRGYERIHCGDDALLAKSQQLQSAVQRTLYTDKYCNVLVQPQSQADFLNVCTPYFTPRHAGSAYVIAYNYILKAVTMQPGLVRLQKLNYDSHDLLCALQPINASDITLGSLATTTVGTSASACLPDPIHVGTFFKITPGSFPVVINTPTSMPSLAPTLSPTATRTLSPTPSPTLAPSAAPILDLPADMLVWLDAQYSTGMTMSGSAVVVWPSKVGTISFAKAYNGGNPTLCAACFSGKPGVDFTSSNGGFKSASVALPSTGSCTVIFVGTMGSSPPDNAGLFEHGDSDFDLSLELNGPATNRWIHFQTNNDNSGNQVSYVPQTPYIYIGTMSATARTLLQISATGVKQTGTGTNNLGMAAGALKPIYLMTSDRSDSQIPSGIVGEVIYYQRVLSASEIASMKAYLLGKWFGLSPTAAPTYLPNAPTPVPTITTLFTAMTVDGLKTAISSSDLLITGCASGSIWGTDFYTDDSTKCATAVHAGLLSVGETSWIRFYFLGPLTKYTGTTQNGITTSNFGNWEGTYTMRLLPEPLSYTITTSAPIWGSPYVFSNIMAQDTSCWLGPDQQGSAQYANGGNPAFFFVLDLGKSTYVANMLFAQCKGWCGSYQSFQMAVSMSTDGTSYGTPLTVTAAACASVNQNPQPVQTLAVGLTGRYFKVLVQTYGQYSSGADFIGLVGN